MVHFSVIPVKTGIQNQENEAWVPASAGMTTFSTIFIYNFQKAKLMRRMAFDLFAVIRYIHPLIFYISQDWKVL